VDTRPLSRSAGLGSTRSCVVRDVSAEVESIREEMWSHKKVERVKAKRPLGIPLPTFVVHPAASRRDKRQDQRG